MIQPCAGRKSLRALTQGCHAGKGERAALALHLGFHPWLPCVVPSAGGAIKMASVLV